ncbi:apospory-associated protein c-related [Holotrichia oblita]|uniref:Apospory-associated protein c-related n=1 Tax=Holotrichia oblita TaxID=644536 RepID=A0ACB9TXG1_HOLOL|nr:apospory-associated protein c-related [Holotrichia oblita]
MKKITDSVVVLDRGYYTTCTINFHGATVVSWRIRNLEQIFVSRQAVLDNKKIIRGGISFVFPHFGPWTFGPQHGFSRITRWKVEKPPTQLPNGDIEVIFALNDDHFTRSMWNYPFQLLYRITLLETELHFDIKVKNLSPRLPFSFNLILFTYLRVPNVSNSQVIGLQEKLLEGEIGAYSIVKDEEKIDCEEEEEEQQGEINIKDVYSAERSVASMETASTNDLVLTVDKPTNMLYPNTLDEHEIEHVVDDKTIIIQKNNLPDTVIWNPWSEIAVPNFDQDEHIKMVGLKTGHLVNPVNLLHGEEFNASLVLKIKRPEIDPMYLFW